MSAGADATRGGSRRPCSARRGVQEGSAHDGTSSTGVGAQVLALLPGQGGFVELTTTEAGHYAIVNHVMSLAEKGAHGVLEVSR